jgi:hypothetical protein
MVWTEGQEMCIARRGQKYVKATKACSKASCTGVFFITALGTLLPPFVIYRSKKDVVPKHWEKPTDSDIRVGVSNRGWMTQSIMLQYWRTVLRPWAEEREGRKFIFMDNLSAHFSVEVLEEAAEVDVQFIPLPPNATHLCQPCDLALFKGLKGYMKQAITDLNDERRKRGLNIVEGLSKAHFLGVLDNALKKLKSREMEQTIRNGFRKAGIFPLNPAPVLTGE